jgi:MerR family transcriptional regulator, copper efflux regulator
MRLINELSKATDTPIPTIRYYEQYGLFKGKRNKQVKSNNYTYYDDEVVEKLALIKEAKEIGFTLAEIKVLIDAWHSKRLSLERRKEILFGKIGQIDEKIAQLRQMKKIILECVEEEEMAHRKANS